MDRIPLNFSLLANPWNWIIILLMIYIVGLAAAAIFHKPILPSVGSK
jgi:hypothetical protein